VKRVAIVDYGVSNLDSVARAVEECGGQPLVTSEPGVLAEAASIVLPGVGAFRVGMMNLRRLGLDEVLDDLVRRRGIPLLGLCLGMHLLATTGSEGGDTPGLGFIGGDIVQLVPREPGERVPHIGWNEVVAERVSPLLSLDEPAHDYYFVHSYHLRPAAEEDVVATTPYCGGFVSVIARENVYGVQFHPEKSSRAGFALLRGFLSL
jgi:imidazole glycerol-phosphate synthase subunit HisH